MALVAVALVAASSVVLLPGAAPAQAAPPAPPAPALPAPPAPAPAAAAPACSEYQGLHTCAYSYEGATTQYWQKPAEVERVSIIAYGAQGGTGSSAGGGSVGVGGRGGMITGTIDVSQMSGLNIRVGGQGGAGTAGGGAGEAGWPWGGPGGKANAASSAGCGGGGASVVEASGFTTFVAGGGGGCGGYFSPRAGAGGGAGGPTPGGGGTGYDGGVFCSAPGTGGGAATANGGGGKGSQGYYYEPFSCIIGTSSYATAGDYFSGGTGSNGEGNSTQGYAGGGGGGGFTGGGGGGGGQNSANGSGGGGGGGGGKNGFPGYSFSTLGGEVTGVQPGNGSVLISYQTSPTTTSITTAGGVTSIEAGGTATFVATVSATNSGAPSGNVRFADAFTGIPLCEGRPIPASYAGRSGSSIWSTASCTFTNTNQVPAQCVPQPPSDPPPPALPPECTYNSNQVRQVYAYATYEGGPATSGSTSALSGLTITPTSTNTVLKPGTDPGAVDIEVATKSGADVPIDGTVTVRDADNTTVEGCVDLALIWTAGDKKGTQTCHVPIIPGVARHLTATYTGGANTGSSTSAVFDMVAVVVPTAVDLTIVDGLRTYGHPLTATATVSVTPPTPGAALDGAVTFTDSVDGGAAVTVPGCVDLPVPAASNGQVGCTIARPVVGSHSLHAHYAGAIQTSASDSPVVVAAITKSTPRTTVVADPPGGASAGQFVALTARVEMSDSTSDHVAVTEGTITFRDRGLNIPGCVQMTVAQPTVTCTLQPDVTTGSVPHSFEAIYTGSVNLQPSASAGLSYVVGLAPTHTTLALVTPSAGPVPAGAEVTIAATVAADTAGLTPVGNVAFFDNGQPVTGCPPPRAVDATGRATCTFVPTAGTSHALTAAYQPAAGGTTASSTTTVPLNVVVGRFASTTGLAVSPADTPTTPVVGDDVTLTATITTSGNGPVPTGTVAFADGGSSLAGCDAVPVTPVPAASPAAASATCTIRPGGGDHGLTAAFGGDVPTDVSKSPTVDYIVHAVGTTTSASGTPSSATALTLVATVAPVSGHAIPTGLVDVAVDGAAATGSCQQVPLVASAAGATASCTWTGDPTLAHEVGATYTPANDDFEGSTGTFSYAAPVPCRAGEDALWAALDANPDKVVVADGHSSLTIAVPAAPGACGGTPVPFTATSISLFGGLVTGDGSGVLTGGGASDSLCLTEGTLQSPKWMNLPALSISAPVCWSLADNGDLGASTRGELAAEGGAGEFPFVALADTPGVAASFSFSAGGANGTSQLELRFVAGPPDAPVLDMSLTVAADGSFTGTLDTPGLVLLGQSLSTFHAEVTGGVGAALAVQGSVTFGTIKIADGVTIDELTISLSTDGFAIAAVASIGVGEHILELNATGQVTDSQNWSLELSARDTEAWEPLPGLTLNPNIEGFISRTAGTYAFDLRAGDPAGSPLVTWQPAAGASVAVQTIRISSAGAPCAAVPAGPEHQGDLVLALTGQLSLSGTTVAIDGCADLTVGAYHVAATASEIKVSNDLVLTNLVLTADGAVGAGLSLVGGGDATIKGHNLHLRFDLTSAGSLVVGASVDLAAWGVPVQGFIAYSSAGVTGFDTGDPTVGKDGVVDLDAGLTAVALWTPSADANDLLSTPAPEGLGLTAGGAIVFTAHISAAAIVFSAEITPPEDLPFLTLPGGTTIDAASLTFTHEGAGNTLALHLAAKVQDTTQVTMDLVLGTDGSFTGEVDVQGLQLFGRSDIALHGSIERARNSAGVMTVQASISGTVGSAAEPIEVAPSVSFTRVELTLGTGGIAVDGDVVISGKAGLTVSGRVFTKADPVTGFGAGGWSLAVSSSSLTEWTPTNGVTFTADLSGTIEKKTSIKPVTFQLAATGASGGDLFTFTPSDAPASLAVKSVQVGNESPAPAACTTRAGEVWLTVAGSFTATIAGTPGTATAAGCFNLTSGQTKISADLSSLNIDLGGGVKIHGPRFTVARAASTPAPAPGTSRFSVTAEVAIDLDILGSPYSSPAPGTASSRLTAQLSYSGSALVVGVRANLGSYGLGGIGGDAYLYYASAPVIGYATGDPALSSVDPKTGATTNGKVDLVKGINFAVRLTLPASVTAGLSQTGGSDGVDTPTGAVTALGQIDTAAKAFTFKVQFKSGIGGQELLRTGDGTRLTLDGGFLKFTVKSGQSSFGLGISATLHLPPVDDPTAAEVTVPLNGELTISTTGIMASLQLGTCGSPETAWTNAFGVDGLTVECAAFQGGISFAGVPTVGFFGKITALPSDVAYAIGYQQGAPMQFAFNLSPLMLSISIGEKNSTNVALRPLQAFGKPDFIQVRYASLYVAPTAVTIGQQTFPAGFGIGFQASIAGVDMNILASIDPTAPSISMYASVSEIKLGALKLGPVTVDLLASPSEFHFKVEGTLALGPGTVDVGPALKIGGDLSVSVSVNILETGFEAYVSGHAAVQLSALLPQDVCWYEGYIPLPCNYAWKSTETSVTLVRTGFAVDGKGISLIADGYRITMLWSGGLTASSATSVQAKLEQAQLEAEIRKGTNKAAAAPPVAAGASFRMAGVEASSVEPSGVEPSGVAASGVETDPLIVAAPVASDEPMAAAPLPAELVVPEASLIGGLSVIAPPDGPNPAGDIPMLDTTTDLVIDTVPVPLLAEGTAPGVWTPTGSLHDARGTAATAALPDGRVLVAGGGGADGPLATAEVYDPATGLWTPTGSLAHARSGAAVAVLPSGRVLVAGGTDATAGDPGDRALSSVEIYDPASGTWSAGAPLAEGRAHATATVLGDGSVLVAGGLGPDGSLATAERYDPAGRNWTSVGPMGTARGLASASRLADGRVLVAGGLGGAAPIASAEIYDPATQTWATTTDMPSASMMDTATTLADGRVLVAGSDANGKVWDPGTGAWSLTGGLGTIRAQAAAVKLADGTVLLVGGTAGGQVETDAEIYNPVTNAWQTTTDLIVGTASASAVVLHDGSVLVVGGANRSTPLAAAAIYRQVAAPAAVPAAAPAAQAAPLPAPVPQAAPLPATGRESIPMILLALMLLAVGSAVVATSRRRRRA